MVWRIKQNKYLLLVYLVFFLFVSVLTLAELDRVAPALQDDFVFLRVLNGVLVLLAILWICFRSLGDIFYTISSSLFSIYVIYSSWFLPLYEFAFFQAALVYCFVEYKRRWLFPVTQVFWGLCFVISNQWQSILGWKIPTPSGIDYFLVIVGFILLAVLMQRYIFQARLDRNQMLHRYGVVGREATRLLHDVKGMLGSPILVADGLLKQDVSHSSNFEYGLKALQQDLININAVVYNLNRLVGRSEQAEWASLLSIVSRSIKGLGVRSQQVSLFLPEDRQVFVVATKLESVFFNLMLNSIEAHSKAPTKTSCQGAGQGPTIEMKWQGDSLIYTDDVGGSQTKSQGNTGLGLVLIEEDLRSMGIPFEYSIKNDGFIFRMKIYRVRHADKEIVGI